MKKFFERIFPGFLLSIVIAIISVCIYLFYIRTSGWESNITLILIFCVGYILLMIKTFLHFNDKRKERWKEYLLEQLADRIRTGKLNCEADSIVNAYKEITEKFNYEDASALMRWLWRLKPPPLKETK